MTASRSRFGVRISRFPAHPMAQQPWSSLSKKRTFGLAGSVLAISYPFGNALHSTAVRVPPRHEVNVLRFAPNGKASGVSLTYWGRASTLG